MIRAPQQYLYLGCSYIAVTATHRVGTHSDACLSSCCATLRSGLQVTTTIRIRKSIAVKCSNYKLFVILRCILQQQLLGNVGFSAVMDEV